jgi:zinc and cadmium transporter
MNRFYNELLLYSSAIAVAVAIGGLLPLRFQWTRRHMPALLSFSAGIMMGAAFFHLLPESYILADESLTELGARHAWLQPSAIGVWIMVGFLFLYVIERFVTVHVCEALDCEVHSVGVSAFIGLAIHALTEGVALGSGLLAADLGKVVFLSIIMHKIPAALALSSILLHEKYQTKTILGLQFLFFMMVPLGAFMVNGLYLQGGSVFLGAAIAFSMGTFLHISLSDLLPEVHRSTYRKSLAFAAFLIGIALMFLMERSGNH